MSTVSIEQKNVIIARFENRKFFGKYAIDDYGPHHGLAYPEMKYHVSWDWLMLVVEKIESLENKRFGVCIDVLDTMIMDYNCTGYDEGEKVIIQTDIYPDNGDTKISITHDAVYQFIQWYQKQHQ
jgi:hypothetical protein